MSTTPSSPKLAEPFPARIIALLEFVANRKPPAGFGLYEDANGEPLQDDADAALRWLSGAQASIQALEAEVVGLRARYEARELEAHQLSEQIITLRRALSQIEHWDLPATGKFWDDEKTRPVSYESEYGSNGARNYMRAVATDAIDAARAAQEVKP